MSLSTVNTLSGSRPDPIGSVYFPAASRVSPGTSEPGSGCRIHVVQPSRSLPFQSDVQPLSARIAIPLSNTPTRSNRGKCISLNTCLQPVAQEAPSPRSLQRPARYVAAQVKTFWL